jgi:hypothetical protein
VRRQELECERVGFMTIHNAYLSILGLAQDYSYYTVCTALCRATVESATGRYKYSWP